MNNRQPLFLFSGDLIADRRYEYAQDFIARGDLTAAADLFAQAAEKAPSFASAWYALGDTQERLQDRAAAAESFAKALAIDTDDRLGAGVRLARLGVSPAEGAMSAGYVRAVFDQYAPEFDRALTQGLAYRAPQLLRDAVTAVCQQRTREAHFASMLDLGCGTGLAGELFRSQGTHLTGVDLSPAMVELARRKARYDALHVGEMLQFARAAPASEFDLVIAADALVYLAALDPLFGEVARLLRPGGLFAFSVETHDGEGIVLGEKLRYAHAAQYVRDAIAGAGLTLAQLEAHSTRNEGGVPVPGLIVVAVRD